ncbi:hypothetical protein [Carboxylicivirga sp. M1479]|uniref:hypothetical protein n=1 Tax=Carboxylicivirga sp. M1479 TaxID=2594476 RepID=UPI001177B156|nr:hypothetical protein [Carboxylicivirga sp. M1479]TRX71078.1 hypothetical protein FNN09_08695 [Carboxylicivirga sp. M1479]
MKSTIRIASFVVAAVMLLTACNSKKSKKDKAPEIKKENVEKEVREFVYPLPTSFEVTEMLNRIEAAYILSLSNPATNVDKYLSEKAQAINLGIYSADLSYASTYRQQQETLDFMNASKSLIDKLDISPALDKELLQAIENNLDNKDELVKVISNTFYNTYEYLNKNDRSSVSLLVIAGSWVEALYIACHISDQTFSNKEMVAIIMNQKDPLNTLMTMLEVHASKEDVKSTIDDLKILQEIYNSIDTGSITIEQLDAIEKNVAVLRDKYVS